MIKKIFLFLLLVLILIQFFRPERNESQSDQYEITSNYWIPDNVNHLLKVACNDCHSNNTNYPWYANVQPVAWWLDHHIEEGKEHLNFSEFTQLPLAVQHHKFEEIKEMVGEEEMPLPSYTYLGMHSEADLDDSQRELLMKWANQQMKVLQDTYPPDSLIMKRRSH